MRYENGLAVQGDTLLEVLDKKQKTLRLPLYIHRIAPDALEGVEQIRLCALHINQVESWLPLLKARRLILQIYSPDEKERIWLLLSHTGGFDAAFSSLAFLSPDAGKINFECYDSRFTGIQDRNLKLGMAISRLLYPVQLAPKARSQYEQLLKNRFRPSMLRLVSGDWNWYGKIPAGAGKLLSMKKMDRFLKKELLERAASCRQNGFVQLLINAAERTREENIFNKTQESAGKPDDELWKQAVQELCARKPEMELFCGLLSFVPMEETVKTDILSACPLTGSRKPAGTDGRHIYYSLQSLQQTALQGKRVLAGLYAHMLIHCIYRHPVNESAYETLYDTACDIAVEYVVDEIFGPGPEWLLERQQIYDRLLGMNRVLTADWIFNWIMTLDEETRSHLTVWFARDSHIFWRGREMTEDARRAETIRQEVSLHDPEKWQTVSGNWASAGEGFLRAGEKKAGKSSPRAGRDQEKADLEKRAGYDYHDFLRQFMVLKEDRILDLDSYDPVYYTYGLSIYGNVPLVEPLETKEVMRLEELVIVIDTSGSCSGRLVRFFLEETWSVFGQSENFFNHFHVRILQCDAMVQEDVKLTSLQEAEHYMKNLVIKGGGGTDFREAFSYIRKLKKQGELLHLKGILYFTDGFGTFPAQPPGCRTAFIFLKARFGQVEVPHWADKLLLELPEGADWEPEYTGGFQVNILR